MMHPSRFETQVSISENTDRGPSAQGPVCTRCDTGAVDANRQPSTVNRQGTPEMIVGDLRQQVGAGAWQLFCFDPNGAKVELDFDASERL